MEDDIALEKKRKRDEQLENKRLLQEEYNRELQEQQYKRLMHLLNRSKFYASYIVGKIGDSTKEKGNKVAKRDVKDVATDENTPPQERKKKKVGQNYDIRNYISEDTHQEVHRYCDSYIVCFML